MVSSLVGGRGQCESESSSKGVVGCWPPGKYGELEHPRCGGGGDGGP